MKSLYLFRSLLTAAVLALLASAPAHAQATRTWVSGVGDDANPCSRTAPCKTFAGAISKTAAAGEISVLDPGGFGSLTITKSISLVADGVEGGVLASGTSGITVNAGTGDNVSIRGLQIEGSGTGTSGIRILQAAKVTIANTVIRGFQAGTGRGVDISPTSAGVFVYMDDVQIDSNLVGIYVHAASAPSGAILNRVVSQSNTTNSLLVDTSTSSARAIASIFATTVASATNGGQIISAGNNFFAGGTGPTSTVPLQ